MTANKNNGPIRFARLAWRLSTLCILLPAAVMANAAPATSSAPATATAAAPQPAASAVPALPEAYVPTQSAGSSAPSATPQASGKPASLLEYLPGQSAQPESSDKGHADPAPWPGFRREVETGSSDTAYLTSEQLYYMQITHHALPVISARQRQAYERDIVRAAHETRVQPALIRAVISAESSYDPTRISPKGAVGLMQVLPETAHRFGVHNVYNPGENIKAGSRYLAFLLRVFNNDVRLALAAYNAGEQAVIRYGNQVPPYRETINYVPRVLSFYRQYLRHPMKAD